MTDFVYDGWRQRLALLDGDTVDVHAVGPGYVPSSSHTDTSSLGANIVASTTADLTADVVGGVFTLAFDGSDPSIDTSGDLDVAGWVLSHPDDDSLIVWRADPDHPDPTTDPYVITTPDGIVTEAPA